MASLDKQENIQAPVSFLGGEVGFLTLLYMLKMLWKVSATVSLKSIGSYFFKQASYFRLHEESFRKEAISHHPISPLCC